MPLSDGASEIAIQVRQEEELLGIVHEVLAKGVTSRIVESSYDEELLALRDAIAEARAEDIPPLVEHMTRLQALAAQRGQGETAPVDPRSPYFGHMRLREAEDTRDVLLGKRTFLSQDGKVRIVDWRYAPVSRLYYSYEEGDDYEESFGGKARSGVMDIRRSVTIADARLLRVACPQSVFVRRGARWVELDPSASRLEGGQGSAVRADGLRPLRGRLGVEADGSERIDKRLPEIAALLDKRQYELITSSASGPMIVQGSAGSGKTTVGLHRVAFLCFDQPKRFRPKHVLIVVFNEGLSSYIGEVLPALGVSGVRVATYARWAMEQRRRHVSGLPRRHRDDTPTVVSRLKKHPAMLRILDDLVDAQDESATQKLTEALAFAGGERVLAAWKTLARLPLDARRGRLTRWLDGEARIGQDRGEGLPHRAVLVAHTVLERIGRASGDIVSDWAELMTDPAALRCAFDFHAPTEFSQGDIESVVAWCVKMQEELGNVREEIEEGGPEREPPAIDMEDEAILLRLYQRKVGWLKGRTERLEHDHIMVDEVQDFSPLEIATLMDTCGSSVSMTLCGDPAQKIHRDSGFVSWEQLADELGLETNRMELLDIAYRSTAQIMELAQEVLGPLAGPRPRVVRQGAPVELLRFSDPGQAVGVLGDALRDLLSREPHANVAVVSRHLSQAKLYYDGLRRAEVPRLSFVADEDFSFAPGVEVTEVRQVKGLEFDYVVMVEVNSDSYGTSDEARHLFHVAATRAAHQLWLVCTSQPSPLIPRWLLEEQS
ncbi:MAG: ATP-binding domain-containing protein [Myxococcota bacterium]|jgi:DNA helicase-2/ATP-dependent DNA helicase PcrA|nr:ATP-binding domain-containing protein [Myxococcota bacterium]